MQDALITAHRIFGYVVFVIVLVAAVYGFGRAKSGMAYEGRPFQVATVLLDLQVTLGIALYIVVSGWKLGATFQFIHPLIMVAGLGVAHAGVGAARRERMAADAYRKVSRMLLLAVVVIAAGIGVASMA